ncbi:hypothetical protein CRV08_11915 [Halarcobacter ebronensis]|uniref:FlgO domain-containing protein n=1 Tax=Halarcobacter ebronensis TaxID=1462615 RepID=A0A4Q0Y950_9BACT|nr:FlgO family outer membrane protein [Halarcobacter ebronensis]RXJ66766.1 hypothetical protein CRV08_11915 [Halarcobacter ebronensis]
MNYKFIKILKYSFTSIFLIIFLTSCSNIAKSIASKSSSYHKNIIGSNDFNSLVEDLIKKQESRLNAEIGNEEVVLVSDFVNIDTLQNHSKLGFLLSEQLKNSLSRRGIIIREIELGRDFQLGHRGFNLLTREQKDIKSSEVDNQFAVVGTYSVTTQSLIVFVKLIDITTGNILSSASSETIVDEEILDLEASGQNRRVIAPMVL